MANFFDSGPLPDWKELRTWLGKDMPWKLAEQWDQADDSGWMDRIVKQALAYAGQADKVKKPDVASLSATKDTKHVVVTAKLPAGTDIREIRLYAAADRLKIAGLPNGRKQLLRLPCLVHARTGKAALRNGKLIVRFRRRPPERNEVELFIRP